MRQKFLLPLCLFPLVLAQQPSQQPGPPGPPTPTQGSPMERGTLGQPDSPAMHNVVNDKSFLKHAAIGGMMEVEMGKLAAQKGASDQVRQFGEKMVTDHTKANEQLRAVASSESIAIPDSLGKKERAKINKLSQLSDAAFDRAYIKDQLKDHGAVVREFQAEATDGENARVKSFAAQTLPTLKEHLAMVKDLRKNSNDTAMK